MENTVLRFFYFIFFLPHSSIAGHLKPSVMKRWDPKAVGGEGGMKRMGFYTGRGVRA